MKRTAGSRKAANRRLGSGAAGEHLLDVRVRRSTAKRQRRYRVLNLLLGITMWVSLAAGAGFGFHAIVNKFFLQNPEYDLKVVDADLDGLMSREEAMQIADIRTGTNIFRVDLAGAERALRDIDQVASVDLQREWPDRITIHLTKRVPVAWIAPAGAEDTTASRTLLLDAQGRTIKPYRVEPDYWRLPLIFVRDPELTQKDDLLAKADLRAALDLLAARAAQPDSLLDVTSIDATKGYALEVVDPDKARFIFSPEDPVIQLQRLQKLLVNCRDNGRKIESVNLIPKKYTPVRFVLAAAQEPTPAPAPTRKKNSR